MIIDYNQIKFYNSVFSMNTKYRSHSRTLLMFFEAKFLQKIVILDYVLSLIKHSNNLRNQRENSNEGGFFKD